MEAHKTYKSWFDERVSSVNYLGTDLGKAVWDYLQAEIKELKEKNTVLNDQLVHYGNIEIKYQMEIEKLKKEINEK